MCKPEPILQSFVIRGYVDTVDVLCPLLCHLGITQTTSVFPVDFPLLQLLRYAALCVSSAFGLTAAFNSMGTITLRIRLATL